MNEEDYQVVTGHRASFSYLVELKVGETVTITGKGEDGWVWCICEDGLGVWVPKGYLARRGDKGVAVVEYSSAELDVKVGERLSCIKEADGWLWCTNQRGERGWVPKTKVRKI